MPVTPPLVTRRKVLGFAVETDSGTAATVTDAMSGTAVKDIKLVPVGFFDNTKRKPQGLYGGSVKNPRGKKLGKLTFKTEMRPGDQTRALLTCCRFKNNTGVYASTSSMADRKTGTFKVWEDGRVKTLYGAAGTAKITMTNGGIVEIEWEFNGIFGAVADASLPSTAPVQSAPYVATGLTLTMGGSAIAHSSTVTIDLGNEVEEREDLTKAAGAAHFLVGDWTTSIEIDTEARKVADHDAYGLFEAGTPAELVIVLTSGTSTMTITAAQVQRMEIDDAERGKRLVDALTCEAQAKNGDDELTFEEVTS